MTYCRSCVPGPTLTIARPAVPRSSAPRHPLGAICRGGAPEQSNSTAINNTAVRRVPFNQSASVGRSGLSSLLLAHVISLDYDPLWVIFSLTLGGNGKRTAYFHAIRRRSRARCMSSFHCELLVLGAAVVKRFVPVLHRRLARDHVRDGDGGLAGRGPSFCWASTGGLGVRAAKNKMTRLTTRLGPSQDLKTGSAARAFTMRHREPASPVTAVSHSQYHDHAVSKLGEELDRFYLAHRRCGALTSGPHGDDAMWMSCTRGATILVPAREEGTEPNPPDCGLAG